MHVLHSERQSPEGRVEFHLFESPLQQLLWLPRFVTELYQLLRNARVYDLAQPYFVGMPHFPTHPPFLFGLTKKHGDLVTPGGVSSSADSIAMGGHVGTHIDALCHFSCAGKLHGNVEAETIQSYSDGIREHSIDQVAPILKRGVLLDVAGLVGQGPLPPDFEITPEHLGSACALQGVEVLPSDVVLIRTGWGAFWTDPQRYITGGSGSQATGPGPGLEAAKWLSTRGVHAAGSDTIAFERVPALEMPVHVHLLVESGIHILEALNLEEISAAGVHQFLFIAAPLKIRGGTGSPVRPLAVVA